MSTITINPAATGHLIQGDVLFYIPLLQLESNPSLSITAPGIQYTLEVPISGEPVFEGNKVTARFSVDENVDLRLILIGTKGENTFRSGQFSLFYEIKKFCPRAHFVAASLMAVMSLAGKLSLNIAEPEISTDLNIQPPLLEISKLLYRRQFAYRLMVIEKVTGKHLLLPPAISETETEKIAFVYHAIVDRSFMWSSGSFETPIPATPENVSMFAQLVQPFSWSLPVDPLIEPVFGQPIDLGRTIVTIEDAVIINIEKVRKQLEAGDSSQVTLEIRSLSGQVQYEFTEIPYSSDVLWEPKIQALIELEPYLDAAITERYHALAAASLAGLTEEEKKEVTTFPNLDEAFMVDTDGERV